MNSLLNKLHAVLLKVEMGINKKEEEERGG